MNERECLENLLLDADIFNDLKNYTNNVNLFDILKISNAELKHSIVLAYIFNPNENHNLGSKPLELLFKHFALNNQITQLEIFDLLDIDYDDFSILREYKNIDILMKSTKNKIVICIENKIWTSEHDNQLTRYKKIIDDEFINYKKVFLYLTPNGYDASDSDNWVNISYDDIVDIIDELNIETINNKVKILIDDYKLMIRRNIMNDYELKELCNKIYKKHKQAFDLIWENKDDDTYYLYSLINDYLVEKSSNGTINYNEKNSTKTYLRFTTPVLDELFPLLSDDISSWKNKNTVFYEIIIGKIQIRVQIAFGFKGVDREKRYNEAIRYLNTLGFNIKESKVNYGYLVRNFSGVISLDNITLEEEQDRKYIISELNKILSTIFVKERKKDNENK